MPVYIVRPRVSEVQSFALADQTFSRKKRPDQIKQAEKARGGDNVFAEIARMIKGFGTLLWGGKDSYVTGVQLAEMTDQDADNMRRERPDDVLVLRDQPINLIDPGKPTSVRASLGRNDPWHLPAVGLRPTIRKKLGTAGKNVGVAILDTGIEASHVEFSNGQIAGAVKLDAAGRKVIPQNPSHDTHGHGTHVAGTLCGKNIGIAPGAKAWNVEMIPHGRGNLSDFILALEWAGQNPDVQIVNMSAGISGYVEGMHEVFSDLLMTGVLPVIAIGNDGHNRTCSPGNYVEVLSVGAANKNKRVCSWSGGGRLNPNNHIYTVPDLVAPGDGILSCVMHGGYEAWRGTSMATPVVSGIAALVLEKYPEITVPELRELLFDSCVDLGETPERQGEGLIQVPRKVLTAPTKTRAKTRRAAPRKKATAKRIAKKPKPKGKTRR